MNTLPAPPDRHGLPNYRGDVPVRVMSLAKNIRPPRRARLAVVSLTFLAVVGLVFYFVPNAKVRFRDVWVGAFMTGMLWKGALEGFSWYMRDMTRFTRVNGSIAAVVVFLVWVYIQAVILLYGVEFTAAYARLRRGRPDEVPAAATPRHCTEYGAPHAAHAEPEANRRSARCPRGRARCGRDGANG